MKYLYFFIPLLIGFFAIDSNPIKVERNFKQETDSVFSWIKAAKNETLNFQQRKVYLEKAYQLALQEKSDSLQNIYFSKIALNYYRLGDSLSFRKLNKLTINLSKQLNDSTTLAFNYWDLGGFYSRYEVKDSAYYAFSKAQKLYEGLNDDFRSGRMLLNMAIIQSDSKDYTGSEVTTIKAIQLLKPLNKYKQLYRCYNNLGVIFNELKEYDKALFYHNKALEYEERIEGENTFKLTTLNNIGVVYKNKKVHEKAIEYYQQALDDESLKANNTKLFAMLFDNLAYSKYKLKDTVEVENLFYTALKIRDSIHDVSGVIVNKLHLAEFKFTYNDTIAALQLANEAKDLAVQSKNHKNTLTALLLLSKLDKKNGYTYTNQYIILNDSLQDQERVIRNKFARIRFETDEFIEENELLSERNKRILLYTGVLASLLVLLYIVISQRFKNTKLKLKQEQQLANEEIYNLMLNQQNKVDEGRRNEKMRISQELHDGVLGRILGTRIVLGVLNDKTDETAVLKREECIDNLKEIEEELRDVSHRLHEKSLDADIGYIKLVENLLEKQCLVSEFSYEFKCDKNINWELVKGDLKMNLYRIIQESVQNINKYANAKHVKVLFRSEENLLYLTIRDNGKGFDVDAKSKGIGLKNIKSRVKSFNGIVNIESKPNQGTAIFIETPLKKPNFKTT